jgi:CRP-like cAMP-binding protein
MFLPHTPHWDKYRPFQQRLDVPAKTPLLHEGRTAQHYIFIEKGCVRAYFTKDGVDKTVQFFFENEGLTSFESFVNDTPSLFTIETIEPSTVCLLPKPQVHQLIRDLLQEGDVILKMTAQRQAHYMNEFVSFIRDTPEERYQRLLEERPHIVQRVPQHYIASYLGVSPVHLSRIKAKLIKGKARF